MTNYVVLKKLASERAGQWEQLTAQNAHSPRHAIRLTIEGGGGPGTYIAVPARSWKEETPEAEQKTVIKFS